MTPPPIPKNTSRSVPPAIPVSTSYVENEESAKADIKFCANICFVTGIIGCIALVGAIFKHFSEGVQIGTVIFAIVLTIGAFFSAVNLSTFKKSAEIPTTLCLIVILFAIPIGTIFGIIGLQKFVRSKQLLGKQQV